MNRGDLITDRDHLRSLLYHALRGRNWDWIKRPVLCVPVPRSTLEAVVPVDHSGPQDLDYVEFRCERGKSELGERVWRITANNLVIQHGKEL